MKYYKTTENFPITRKGIPMPDETEITEKEYNDIVKSRNAQVEADKAIEDAKPKPKSDIELRLEKLEEAITNLVEAVALLKG